MRPRLWLAILIGMIVAVAMLGWQLSRRSTSSTEPPVARATPALSAATVRESPRAAAVPPAVPAAPDVVAPSPPTRAAVPAGRTAVAANQPAGGLELHRIDGFSLVRLGGGAPAIRPYGGRGNEGKRRIHGRVLDAAGAPVAGAIVLADLVFHIERDTLMTLGGAVSANDGSFEMLDAPTGPCAVIALAGADWSTIATAAGDEAVELRMIGHGSLAARMTYDGGPETFAVRVTADDRRVVGRYQTSSDGTLAIESLPPGAAVVEAGLAQALGGGVSRSATATVTIERAKTAEVDLAIASGTTVEVTAVPPPDSKPKGITYWLFTGAAPSDGVDATARKAKADAPSMTVGGGMSRDAVEFHDVAPGSYWACAGFFDLATMGAFARPFGCTQVVVREGDDVRDVTVPLS